MKLDEGTLVALQKILAENKGNTPLKIELSDLTIQPPVRVQLQLTGGLNIQANGVQALKTLFGDNHVLPMGPNRKAKRPPPVEAPLFTPAEELIEVG